MSGIISDNQGRSSGLVKSAGGGDFVKIATAEVTGSAVSSVDLQGCFTSAYDNYQIHFNRLNFDGGAYFFPSFLGDDNVATTGHMYCKGIIFHGDYGASSYQAWYGGSSSGLHMNDSNDSYRDDAHTHGIIYLPDPQQTRLPSSGYTQMFRWSMCGGKASRHWISEGACYHAVNHEYGGISFKGNSDNIEVGFKATVYGIKT
jgi:hypothetical protein